MRMQEQVSELLARLPALLDRTRLDPRSAEKAEELSQVLHELRSVRDTTENGLGGDFARRQLELLKQLFDSLVALRNSGNTVDADLEKILASDLAKSFAPAALAPEVMELAQRQVDEGEIAAGLREIEETGGLELRDFIHEIRQAAGIDE
jgi:hypothetical protein